MGAAPVVIDLSKLKPHTRGQAFWDRFCPPWAVATVRDDGTVEIDAAVQYTFPGGGCAPSDAVSVRRRRAHVREWIGDCPAILRDADTGSGE